MTPEPEPEPGPEPPEVDTVIVSIQNTTTRTVNIQVYLDGAYNRSITIDHRRTVTATISNVAGKVLKVSKVSPSPTVVLYESIPDSESISLVVS